MRENKVIDNIIKIFLIIQPIFDLKIFYNSISTLIRIIIIFSIFLLFFIYDKNKKKYWFLIYFAIVGIYFIFHNLNAFNFKSLVPGDFNYSTLKEFLYLIKMTTPFLLIYIIKESGLNKKDLTNIINLWTIIIGLIIIVSNIFCFSYGTYSDMKIKDNIVSWFTNNNYNYMDLCSKGLFEYGNQISAILIITLTINLYESLKRYDKKDIIIILINMFSLFLIGTKVAVFGAIIVFVYVFLFAIIFKNKTIKNTNTILVILFFGLYCLILPFNPILSRMKEYREVLDNNMQIETNIASEEIHPSDNINIEESKEEIKEVNCSEVEEIEDDNFEEIRKKYREMHINENFIENRYPYKYDSEFWNNIIDDNNVPKSDYRFLEKAMVKRVIEINNNKTDIWLGISNTRVQNIFNIEQDFVVQYYALGIIGSILLLVPYFLILFKYLYKIKENMKLRQVIVNIITILFIFAIAIYSGNLLNSLSFTIYFTVLFGIASKEIKEEEIDEKI